MNHASPSNAVPLQYKDGTIASVIVHPARRVGRHQFLEVSLPANALHGTPLGRFVMARCSRDASDAPRTDWGVYLRRPLFVAAARPLPSMPDVTSLTLLLPDNDDPGYRLLGELEAGQRVNLLGPIGRAAVLPETARQLLLVASGELAPLLLPAAEQMLDRGGRVTMIVRDAAVDGGLLSLLPLSVEIQAAADSEVWTGLVSDGIAWADALVIADFALTPQAWADTIRRRRLTLDDAFAQILMPADLLCCTGACMACVVPRANGSLTRACVHGPVFPLASLVD